VIVVDSSVAVQWVVPEDHSAISDTVLLHGELIAPDLLLIEVANVLRKKLADGSIKPEHAQRGLTFISRQVDLVPSSSSLVVEAFDLANEIQYPVYDCLYLVLARRNEARLATHDDQLRRRAVRAGLGKWIADLPLEASP
jgi:predicted nucleic acid-binding protein